MSSIDPHPTSLAELAKMLDETMLRDRHRLRRQLRGLERPRRQDAPIDGPFKRLAQEFARSRELFLWRRGHRPPCEFDANLPILARRAEIQAAIRDHQVVVVCGETGSGKSTQLPKMCLDLGRGVAGLIGHTQPRRLAARSIAARLAEELGTTLGQHVGYQVRFSDVTRPETFIKLMTDGILLAETQADRFLDRYDTLIVDEAHERSLNIDFLLGYLCRLLPKRRDLHLIITSATIDAASFAGHFSQQLGGAPVPIIEVSGRVYEVDVRYRTGPADEEGDEATIAQQVANAVEELHREGPGDILVFLPTERDILDVNKVLRGRRFAGERPELLPLYARLSAAEQNKVFQTGSRRRVVLATNVAESSLTVPGIRFVVDTGTARISRYSPRLKVQRLPIEAISRASADQRKGRCGRIGPGICIRLYSAEDFQNREQYATPEIRRTNLAAVILRMLALGLGEVDEFPFLDPPRVDAINDGYRTLFELGAIDARRQLTELGRRLSRWPIDPRIGRMILAGASERCLHEVLIIAAALEIQDPRERPVARQEAADEKHARFQHEDSDFLGYLKLWDFVHELRQKLSRNQLRRACQQNFLSPTRLREWQEVHRQLLELARESGLPHEARRDDGGAIHRALLTGLLSNLAMRRDQYEYEGTGGTTFYLWPGSSVFRERPKWIAAAELVETTRRYLRIVARIDARWVEPLAGHLVKRSYHDPFWSRKSATVLAFEKVTLLGLTLVAGRRRPYAHVDPDTARRLFIEHALVQGDFNACPAFLEHNRRLLAELRTLGGRARTNEFVVSDARVAEFYESRLDPAICDGPSLDRWLAKAPVSEVDRLRIRPEELLPATTKIQTGPSLVSSSPLHDGTSSAGLDPREDAFPSRFSSGPLRLEISYRFQPGDEADGLTIDVPREALAQLDAAKLEWLVPGRLVEKLTALIRGLPKPLRTSLIPAPDVAARAAACLAFGDGDLLMEASRALSEIAGEPIPVEAFQLDKLPSHLRMNVRVVDENGRTIAQGRDLGALRRELGVSEDAAASVVADAAWQRDGLKSWDFGELPEMISLRRGSFAVPAFPAIVDQGDAVSLRLLPTAEAAERVSRSGLRRLVCILEQRDLKSHVQWLPRLSEIEVLATTLPAARELRRQLIELLAELAFVRDQPLPRSSERFASWLEQGRRQLPIAVQDVTALLFPLFEQYHQARLKLDEIARNSQWREAADDMRQQLAGLLAERFLVETPWRWLAHFPRFLQGVAARCDRLRTAGSVRDRQARQQVEPFTARIREHDARQKTLGGQDDAFDDFRGMVEEFRVSLFAQQLGTSCKISPQRLEKQWHLVR